MYTITSMSIETIRSGQKQINDEVAELYKRMTDPEEREKHKLKQEEEEYVDNIIEDAGL